MGSSLRIESNRNVIQSLDFVAGATEQGAQAQAHDAFDEMRITPVSIKHPIGQSVRRNLISRSTHMHHAYIRYCGRGESVIKIKLLNY